MAPPFSGPRVEDEGDAEDDGGAVAEVEKHPWGPSTPVCWELGSVRAGVQSHASLADRRG
jgi:hypothetical protein